jgi:hypothetical protein
MRTAETVLGVIRVPRRRSLASLVRSKDSCGVLRGVVGKVPSGNSLAAYPTAPPVLRGGGGSDTTSLPNQLTIVSPPPIP